MRVRKYHMAASYTGLHGTEAGRLRPSSLPCDNHSCQLPLPITYPAYSCQDCLCHLAVQFALAMLPLLCASAFLPLPVCLCRGHLPVLTTPVCSFLIGYCCHAPMAHSKPVSKVLQLSQHTIYKYMSNVFYAAVLCMTGTCFHGQASVHAMQTSMPSASRKKKGKQKAYTFRQSQLEPSNRTRSSPMPFASPESVSTRQELLPLIYIVPASL